MADGKRRYKSDRKDHKVSVKLSEKDMDILKAALKRTGMTASAYIRELIRTGGNIDTSYPEERARAIRVIAGIANNINQAVKLSENRIKFSYSFFDTSYEFKFSSLQTEIYFFLVVIRSNKHPIKNPTRVPQVFIITSSNCANLPINVCKNSMPIENTAPSITPFHQCL